MENHSFSNSVCDYINSTLDYTFNYKFTIRIIKIKKKIIIKVIICTKCLAIL